ncbi:hypothetical protein P5V15_008628 [Pogonomyrmex californicus]
MAHSHNSNEQCQVPRHMYHVSQTINEVFFERGIWKAALDGDIDQIKYFLQKGVFVDVLDSAGYTALHYAARGGHVHVCELLLKNGANVNSRTRCLEATALHRAIDIPDSDEMVEMVDLLLRNGADPNLTDVDGKTALHRAILETDGNLNSVEVIAKLLPITNHAIKNNRGQTIDDLLESLKKKDKNVGKRPIDPEGLRLLLNLYKSNRKEVE